MMKFPNGKKYIGQSVDIYNRIKQHNWASTKDGKTQTKLYNALNKYGLENVELIILWKKSRDWELEEETKREMDKLEIEYIKEYDCIDNGYNVLTGGQAKHTGYWADNKAREKHCKVQKEWREKPSIKERFNLIYEYGTEKAAELCGMSEESFIDSINYIGREKSLTSYTKANNAALTKSKENPEVMELMTKHYDFLRKKLVRNDNDADMFGDCILYLTYKYNPEEDFIAQFITQFNKIRWTHSLDKKQVDIAMENIDDWENLTTDDEYLYY